MADGQSDLTPQQKRLLEDRAKRRSFLRLEFQKQISNPHIHASGEGGAVFDAAIQRYIAMKATGYDHFKPTPRTSYYGIVFVAIPILAHAYILTYFKDKEEKEFSTGQVAYKDRRFMFQ